MENLKYLLNTNQIDQNEYACRVRELKIKREEKKESAQIASKDVRAAFLITGIVLIWIFVWLNHTYVEKEYLTADLKNLPPPIQIATTGYSEKKVGKVTAKMDHLAEYKIQGRVVDIQRYYTYELRDMVSPCDIGLVWGFLARDENLQKVDFYSTMVRSLRIKYYPSDWRNNSEGGKKLGMYFSNNHIVAANRKVEKQLKAIEKDDYVELTGYLVKTVVTDGEKTVSWGSSLSRLDEGDHACESIYVESVKWLKAPEN